MVIEARQVAGHLRIAAIRLNIAKSAFEDHEIDTVEGRPLKLSTAQPEAVVLRNAAASLCRHGGLRDGHYWDPARKAHEARYQELPMSTWG